MAIDMLLIYHIVTMKRKIKWYYTRKGWTTCTKASKFLESYSIQILEEVSANKKLNEMHASNLLKEASKIIIFKGKKISCFRVRDEKETSIIPLMLGPTGNLRAPSIIYGDTIVIGFNEEKFEEIFS